jgi:hypothetical protein
LGKKIDAIILSQEEVNKALLAENSDYVGQIYRDDDKNEYSVTKLIELYGKRRTIEFNPKIILKQSKNVWGKKVDIFEVMDDAKRIIEKENELV